MQESWRGEGVGGGREGGRWGGGGRRWEEGRREGDSHESWSLSMGRVSLCYSIVGTTAAVPLHRSSSALIRSYSIFLRSSSSSLPCLLRSSSSSWAILLRSYGLGILSPDRQFFYPSRIVPNTPPRPHRDSTMSLPRRSTPFLQIPEGGFVKRGWIVGDV